MGITVLKAGLVDVDFTLVVQLGIFLVLFALLRVALFGPVLRVLVGREERVTEARQEAEALENKAASHVDIYETRMKEARGRALKERDGLRSEGTRLGNEIVAATRTEVQRQIDEARSALDVAARGARAGLAAEEGAIARSLAGTLLGRGVG